MDHFHIGATNAVYLNGAGTGGWLRLNASGAENNYNTINIQGGSAGNFIDMRTNNVERLRINSSGVVTGTTTAGSNAKFEVVSTTVHLFCNCKNKRWGYNKRCC